MGQTASEKLIAAHLVRPSAPSETEIAIRVDQTLTQDATGTLVMLALEAMQIDRVRTQLSAQYVDHNLVQADFKNADDHLFLESACKRFGIHFSRPGAGVSHPLHMQLHGRPGATLLGSDSHTCAAGSLGMLAIGAGGLDVAMAMAGEPFRVQRPRIWGVRLVGVLPPWVSAKDVILELLRRHGVSGGIGKIIEYFGPGVAALSAMDRHVIANMGAELGATSTVFPSDERTREFLVAYGRSEDWRPVSADPDAAYDPVDEIDLSKLVPLIAKPQSPGNVVPVREVVGEPIYQAYLGSSANPGYRDFAVPALMVREHQVAAGVSFDVNPTSRSLLEDLIRTGMMQHLVRAGARLHQAGCNGCIGMGQAPATGKHSLRTTPRNFPGRSGTADDSVWLCSPETATASAITGVITDPRDLDMPYPVVAEPVHPASARAAISAPIDAAQAREVELVKGPNIGSLPEFEPIADVLELPVLLKVGNDLSTDEILPAGMEVLPYRSNIEKLAGFAFRDLDPSYTGRARSSRRTGHAIVARENYGQGSSREHAALAPRQLGLRIVIAMSFARIHRQNLVNFGVLPLEFTEPKGFEAIDRGATLRLEGIHEALRSGAGECFEVEVKGERSVKVRPVLSPREVDVVLRGGLVAWKRASETAEGRARRRAG